MEGKDNEGRSGGRRRKEERQEEGRGYIFFVQITAKHVKYDVFRFGVGFNVI